MSGTTKQVYLKHEKGSWFSRLMKKLIPSIVYAKTSDDLKKGDIVVEVHWSNNCISFYKGSVTVWHTWPMMKRCDSWLEEELCDIWSYFKEHGSPYPTAHEK